MTLEEIEGMKKQLGNTLKKAWDILLELVEPLETKSTSKLIVETTDVVSGRIIQTLHATERF